MGSLPSVARLSGFRLTRGFASQPHDWFALVEKGGVFVDLNSLLRQESFRKAKKTRFSFQQTPISLVRDFY